MVKKLTYHQTEFLQRVHELTKDSKIMIRPANTYVGGGYIRAITNRILHSGKYSESDKLKLDLIREWYIKKYHKK